MASGTLFIPMVFIAHIQYIIAIPTANYRFIIFGQFRKFLCDCVITLPMQILMFVIKWKEIEIAS